MMMASKIIKDFLAFFVLVFLVSGTFFMVQQFSNASSGENFQANLSDAVQPVNEVDQLVVSVLSSEENDYKIEENNSQVNAISAISIKFGDTMKDEVLFAKNEHEKLPIASLVKLMTALVVLENYDLEQEVVISKAVMEQVGEQGNLKKGQVLLVKDLLSIALIESSNRAAFALAEVISTEDFVSLMNSTAEHLGLKNTHFEDSTGLSKESYSTTRNLVELSKHLFLNFPLFREVVSLKTFDLYLPDGSLHHTLINTNELLGQNTIVGGKTGYTHQAKGCFMVIQKESSDEYIIHVILGAEDRVLEMQNLINKVLYLTSNI